MKFKILTNAIVYFFIIFGFALMAYADIMKTDFQSEKQIETIQKKSNCQVSCVDKIKNRKV